MTTTTPSTSIALDTQRAARQKRLRQRQSWVSRMGIHLILLLLSVMALVPVLWMISSSLKASTEIFVTPIEWLPRTPRWGNYTEAFNRAPIMLYFWNTMIVCGFSVLGVLISSSLVAFSFSRLQWPGRNFFFGLLLATMMLPGIILIVPRFLMFSYVFQWPGRWIGTFLPLIVPAYFATHGLFVFLIRQFFLGIPVELDDAARIDGASSLRILWQIFVPLSKPVMITVIILSFMQFYNDFLEPLVYLKPATWTLAVGIRAINDSAYATSWELVFATGTFMLAPMVVIFFVAQRYFVEGVTLSGFGGR
ncbi:MAG TPA: carbohydrate ABC transporter permease [Caldilineaceae bacterium]|nr:carbohydrate ABC transporter permease [Caldilineaceae bacterium]